MATANFHVPTVDLTPYTAGGDDEQRAATAAALDRAARTIGFIQITGHGVPDEVIDTFADALDAFFGLPLDAKKGYRSEPEVNRGYSPPKTESLSLSLGLAPANRMHDFFEAFNVGVATSEHPGLHLPHPEYAENLWPDVPGFEPAVRAYFAEARRVARALTTAFGDALGLPGGFFTPFTDHSVDVLRMNNYALDESVVELDGELVGMGAHTDYGIVTVLWADQVPGLQVLGHDGEWNDVLPADGALLVNLGDLMARWTNDAWISTVHRVVPPIVDGRVRRRRSAAYFHDGNLDALIEALPTTAGGEVHYPPIRVRDHLAAKLGGSRVGVPNTTATREASRVLAATGAEHGTRP